METGPKVLVREAPLKYCWYIILSASEAMDFDALIGHYKKMVWILKAMPGVFIIVIVWSVMLGVLPLVLSLTICTLGIVLLYIDEAWMLGEITSIVGCLPSQMYEDFIIIAGSGRYADIARRHLERACGKGVESEDLLAAFSPKLVLISLLSDVLIFVGIWVMFSEYGFLSLVAFAILGVMLLYVFVDLFSRLMDFLMVLGLC